MAFVKEYQEEGKTLIKFVKSEENDPITTFKAHQAKFVWKRMKLQERIPKHKYQSTGRMSNILCVTHQIVQHERNPNIYIDVQIQFKKELN